MSRPETLQKKYVGKVSRKALSFMKILLNMEPSERPASKECLSDAYFDGLIAPVSSSSSSSSLLQSNGAPSSSSANGQNSNSSNHAQVSF